MVQFKKGMVKRNMKKILSVLLISVCLLGLTACGSEKVVDEHDRAQVEEVANYMISTFAQLEDSDIEGLKEEGAEYIEYVFGEQIGLQVDGNGILSAFDSWAKATKEAGKLNDVNGFTTKYSTKGDTIIVDADVQFETRSAVVEFIFKDDLHKTLTSVATNINYSFGEKMEKAGLNTLLGMGTVFIVLILLTFLISAFKLFAVKPEKAVATAAPVTSVAEPVIETNVSDDGELIAVISAAIAAFEATNGGSADGYVVRSITRRTSNKWNRN